jgi:hypothetical protein
MFTNLDEGGIANWSSNLVTNMSVLNSAAPATVDWFAVIVSAFAFVGIVRWKCEIIPVVIAASVAGLVVKPLV